MLSRRDALRSTLFGAGYVGLRALATGLPVSFLLNPRRALAAGAPAATCASQSKARYVIFATSGNGDPINANVPGTYEDSKIVHPVDPTMAPQTMSMGGKQYRAGAP